MSNVVIFPEAASKPAPSARYETVAGYGSVGPVTVSLVRRLDAMAGLIHVVVIGQLQGVEIIATMPDDEKGRAVADFTGPAALRAVELAETEFAVAETCLGASA